VRWWLVAAGVLCGLATGVKWSGLYVLATLGILTVVWDVTARRTAGVRLWVGGALARDAGPAFLSLVPVALLTYLATWTSWFVRPDAYMRRWAAENPALTRPWLPDALEAWWEYHRMMWQFHTTLSSPHAYEAPAWGWLVMWRPTSFFWADSPDGAACGAGRCVQAITSVGNPVLWWAGIAALAVVVYGAARLRDWRAWTVLAGYLATWAPWLAFPERTIFTFYAVALAPFVALAVTYLVAMLLGWRPAGAGGPDSALGARERRREPGPWVAGALVLLVLAASWWMWPVWTAEVISYDGWRWRMWLPSWI
jgi:dolichyl-phosphate-mannose--protein O-mannosyl transferase